MATATKEKTVLFRAWRLTMQEGTHNKFYDVFAGEDGTLVLNWGRIGTSGQSKVEVHTAEEAKNMAMRQVYAKASKGYRVNVDDVQFPVADQQVNNMRTYQSGVTRMVQLLDRHMNSDAFLQQQRLAMAHYDKFIEDANKVLDQAAQGQALENLLDSWNGLAEAWKELDDKHGHALAAVRLVQSTVQTKLMSG